MSLAGERILEYVENNGPGSPKEMEDSGYAHDTRSYISQRSKKLVNYGLLQHLGNGVYQITADGEAYLEGELDASELDEDSEE